MVWRWKMKVLLAFLLAILFAVTAAECRPLRIGTLPVGEGLPLWYAEDRGIFQREGVEVEVVPFQSAMERDLALQTGRIDGAIGDLVGTLIARRAGLNLKVVTVISRPKPQQALFSLVSAPGVGTRRVEDLEGRPVAISSNTVIEYVLDEILRRRVKGVRKVEIKKIPLRFQMVLTGEVVAAVLPEPLASLAITRGAGRLEDDRGLKGTEVVLVFREEVIRSRRGVVEALGRAWQEVVRLIEADPHGAQSVLFERARIPREVRESYFPPLCPVGLPSEEDLREVILWLHRKGIRVEDGYRDLVDPSFLRGQGR
ncbi:MAG TPA: transporter substrate-binding domain-containing protein [Deltaproteobacteria bacterium]|nr:transporter substrate-binding domain-containing protein [Deltaproteobacteria bacterium]